MDDYPPNHFFNIGSEPMSKYVVQSFYRQQLDRIMEQKNQQKLLQKRDKEKEKEEFNDRLKKLNELEQLKDLSYKNYYQMLMLNQNKNKQQFIPNNKQRQDMKIGFIDKSTQDDRSRNIQMQMKQRERDMKQLYKDELYRQMQEKRRAKSVQKIQQRQEGEMIRSLSKANEWEHQRKLAQQMNYKEVLDRAYKQKQKSKSFKHHMSRGNEFNLDQYHRHNPLNNPLPYNIQNPYILRQMSSSIGKNQSYLASIANNNI